ncbi:MAG: CPBP family intramembrane metalloprotease [Hyphomicrobiaceae bacterium]|nr:CPBP family intramembrane metalloprotease [Hyphomicrobiaceae bacterium]
MPLRATRLLIGLRLRRALNRFTAAFQRRHRAAAGQRTATPGKAKLGWLIGGLVALAMVFSYTNFAYLALVNFKRALGFIQMPVQAPAAQKKITAAAPTNPQAAPQQGRWVRLAPAPGFTLSAGVLQAAALEMSILLAAALMLSLAGIELVRPEWDMEWLATLPVGMSMLLAARIVERTVVGPGLIVLVPFLTVLAWDAGHHVGALPLGLAAALPLAAIAATVRTIIDTGLRLSVSPAQLRNLNALVSIASIVILYLAISPGTSTGSYVIAWATSVPAWMFWLPPGLATAAVAGAEPASAVIAFLELAAEATVCVVLGAAFLRRQLRFGVVAAGARESSRSVAATRSRMLAPETGRRLLSPIQARELRLLARDRNYLVQTLVLPVVIVGAQVLINARGNLFGAAGDSPEHLAALGFGIAAYALMLSAFQTLNSEGNALWILVSLPRPLESILRQKALLWGAVCLVYPAALFAFAAVVSGGVSLNLLGLAVVVLLGVPIYAVIATSLGVFGSDPLAQEVQRRVRPSYVYLYMLLASVYVYAIYASSIWQRAALMVLTALLGFALWQKARDHLPYLLDPSASPPARVSLSDGLIAALMFFVLQALVSLGYVLNGQKVTGSVLLVAFVIAGGATFLLMQFAFARLKSEGVPAILGTGNARAAAWGIGGGAVAALGALIYVRLIANTSLFENARESALFGPQDGVWLVALAVVAAPIFEEFIFRGLIFGGLRRTLGLAVSVLASAAIFALVHPPIAAIPVFGLGIVAALIYARTRLLIGPMAAHAVYNAVVVGYQFLSWGP